MPLRMKTVDGLRFLKEKGMARLCCVVFCCVANFDDTCCFITYYILTIKYVCMYVVGISPDVIYIDADHHYEPAKEDISTALKLFPDAVLVGDDYGMV